MYIYKIVNKINNKVYIGQTKYENINVRFSSHRSQLRKNLHTNEHLQKSWNKYKEENFEFTVLKKVNSYEDLDNEEKYYINYFKSFISQNGYNKTLGGHLTKEFSEETKEKIRIKALGRKHSKETKAKMSLLKKGKYPWIKGKKYSEESKNKMSLSKKGKKTWNYGLKMNKDWSNHRKKQIICLNNNVVYSSIHEAAVSLNLLESKISSVCRGIRNHTGNYKFKYLNNVGVE